MPLTKDQEIKLVSLYKEGKTYSQIADILNLNRRSMATIVRDNKHLFYEKPKDVYFNVDFYLKQVKTI